MTDSTDRSTCHIDIKNRGEVQRSPLRSSDVDIDVAPMSPPSRDAVVKLTVGVGDTTVRVPLTEEEAIELEDAIVTARQVAGKS